MVDGLSADWCFDDDLRFTMRDSQGSRGACDAWHMSRCLCLFTSVDKTNTCKITVRRSEIKILRTALHDKSNDPALESLNSTNRPSDICYSKS